MTERRHGHAIFTRQCPAICEGTQCQKNRKCPISRIWLTAHLPQIEQKIISKRMEKKSRAKYLRARRRDKDGTKVNGSAYWWSHVTTPGRVEYNVNTNNANIQLFSRGYIEPTFKCNVQAALQLSCPLGQLGPDRRQPWQSCMGHTERPTMVRLCTATLTRH